MKSVVLKYDGSFPGFLTCVFNAYEQKLEIAEIIPEGEDQKQLFSDTLEVITEDFKVQRVLKSLKQKLSSNGFTRLYYSFLSEIPGIELKMFPIQFPEFSCLKDFINRL